MSVGLANDQLFKKLLGKTLGQVSKELGFPSVPPTVFKAEDIMIFQQHMDQLPTSHQTASVQLVRALQKGTVVGIHTLEDGKTQVAVDFTHSEYRCTLVLVHWREQWETRGVPSVLPHKKKLTLPLTVVGFFAVVVLGGLAVWNGGVFGNNSVAMSLDEAMQAVEEEGYLVLTPEQKNDIVAVAEQQGYEKAQQEKVTLAAQKTETSGQTQDDKAETDDEKSGETRELSFTMKEGMTAQDLTKALKQFGLIDSEIAFGDKLQDAGVAQKVRPGTYTFTSDMGESEIMAELE